MFRLQKCLRRTGAKPVLRLDAKNMRQLVQPRVLALASIAALVTTLACYPRISLWLNRSAPLWYLEAVIFFCGIILWGFVFAWHEAYTHRPVFTRKLEPRLFITVTVAGIAVATAFHLFIEPVLRLKTPEDYPANLRQWLAMALFSLAFNQLFFIFAPFAWLMRLFQDRRVATMLTVLFGAFVLMIKNHSVAQHRLPFSLLAMLLAVRIGMGFLAVLFYLRGGVLLSWWWTFLIEARNLPDFTDNPLTNAGFEPFCRRKRGNESQISAL